LLNKHVKLVLNENSLQNVSDIAASMTQPPPPRRSTAKNTTWGGLALAALVAAYSFGRPIVNERMGWDFPAITGNTAAVVDSVPTGSTFKPTQKPNSVDEQPLYGILKDLGGERFVSPAGLMFTRGGAEGHRLDHLERHTEDDPGRPGKHGVFDGGMENALKTIDRAYERAKTGTRTTKEVDQGRTIYTVDMGGRVGYIGGQDGNRQRKPMARRVRLVLDQNRVITAYPL